jgi:hypothetical protein
MSPPVDLDPVPLVQPLVGALGMVCGIAPEKRTHFDYQLFSRKF